MKNLLKRAPHLTWLIMAGLLSLQYSNAQAAPKQGQQFKDWVTVCQKIPGKTQQHCHIAQTASDKVTKKVVLHTMIGYLVGSKDPVAIFILPDKLNKKTKLNLTFDHKFSADFSIQNCDKEVCNAGVPLDGPMMQAFKKGKVTFLKYKLGEKEKKIPISLMGVSAGLKSLK